MLATFSAKCLLSISVAFLLVSDSSIGICANPELANVLEGLKALRLATNGLEGSGVHTLRNGDEVRGRSALTFIFCKNSQRVEVVDLKSGKVAAHAQSQEKGYRFNLRKNIDGDGFVIAKLDRVDPGAGPEMRSVVSNWLCASYMLYGRSLIDILDSDNLKLESIEDGVEDDTVVLKFEFPTDGRKVGLGEANLVLIPTNSYSIQSFSATTEIGGVDGGVEYNSESLRDDGIRFPQRVFVREWDGVPGRSTLLENQEFEFDSLALHPYSAEDFSLESFGVEEINLGGRGFGYGPFVLVVTSVFLVAGWVYFRNGSGMRKRGGRVDESI